MKIWESYIKLIMGQQVTKMMPYSLACMCVIISDVVALFILLSCFLILLSHQHYRLSWRVIQNIQWRIIDSQSHRNESGGVIVWCSIRDKH